MKNIKEFLNWLVFKNQISLVYYLISFGFIFGIIYSKKEILEHNNTPVFYALLMFLIICVFLFTFVSVIPEYKKRND